MKDKIFGVLQRVGRSFMLPIAILPVAGLLLGIGGSFTNETMLETYGLLGIAGPGTILNAIFLVMSDAGNIVFANLPIIFAMGVAIGMAKKEKEVAALSAAIAFFIMHASIGALININGGTDNMLNGATTSVCGITSLQMGVFGGILVGLGVAALHNKFYKIQLPQVLSFFGGTRFVPIICGVVYVGVGILMYFIWPVIQSGIYAVGNVVLNSGYFGTWVYGLMERLLLPFGLHHVFYLPFWQTGLGGSMEVGGVIVEGAQNIFFAQLADPNHTGLFTEGTKFFAGRFATMMFGLPGAALAMYHSVAKEKRKAFGGLFLGVALTSFITGITEPLEFMFLFVSPLLYVFHSFLDGVSFLVADMLNISIGNTFSGGFIDYMLFGVLQGNEKTNWIFVPIVGVVWFFLYYFSFRFFITKFNIMTPGRGEDEDVETAKSSLTTKESLKEEAIEIIAALGAAENIEDVDACITRLRVSVKDKEKVDRAKLKSMGAAGIIEVDGGVQVVYGAKAILYKNIIVDILGMDD